MVLYNLLLLLFIIIIMCQTRLNRRCQLSTTTGNRKEAELLRQLITQRWDYKPPITWH